MIRRVACRVEAAVGRNAPASIAVPDLGHFPISIGAIKRRMAIPFTRRTDERRRKNPLKNE